MNVKIENLAKDAYVTARVENDPPKNEYHKNQNRIHYQPKLIYAQRPTFNLKGKRIKSATCDGLDQAAIKGDIKLRALVRGVYPGRLLSENILPGIRTIGYWDAEKSQSWGLDFHRNEGLELTFLASGHLDYTIDEKEYLLKPNDLTVARPWQIHKVGNPNIGPNKLFWIILDVKVRRPNQSWYWPNWIMLSEDEISELTQLLRENENPVWQDCRELSKCFNEIGHLIDSYQNNMSPSHLVIKLNELFYLLLQMYKERKISLKKSYTSNKRTVELFLESISDNLIEDWSIEDMSTACGVGTTSFVTYCKEITNLTPVKYLKQLRVEKAKRLLIECQEMTVLDIAMECGFNTSQYFAKCFKEETGWPPTVYKMLESEKR